MNLEFENPTNQNTFFKTNSVTRTKVDYFIMDPWLKQACQIATFTDDVVRPDHKPGLCTLLIPNLEEPRNAERILASKKL